jgi:predicted double-glycine peptidase
MKIPLRYQITEFDCGPTSLINAFSYLYAREELPADLIRAITLYTLDEYNHTANAGGTSKEAMSFLSKWLTSYASDNKFNLVCKRYEKDEVNLNEVRNWIDDKGVLIVRLIQENEHYVILTSIDDKYVYLFDPYYFEPSHYDNDSKVDIIYDEPKSSRKERSFKK